MTYYVQSTLYKNAWKSVLTVLTGVNAVIAIVLMNMTMIIWSTDSYLIFVAKFCDLGGTKNDIFGPQNENQRHFYRPNYPTKPWKNHFGKAFLP